MSLAISTPSPPWVGNSNPVMTTTPVARALARVMEFTWKLLRIQNAPLLNSARIKFLGLHLDYSIDKAVRQLNYQPSTDFRDAMKLTVSSGL